MRVRIIAAIDGSGYKAALYEGNALVDFTTGLISLGDLFSWLRCSSWAAFPVEQP